jgi:hypothetical protein
MVKDPGAREARHIQVIQAALAGETDAGIKAQLEELLALARELEVKNQQVISGMVPRPD